MNSANGFLEIEEGSADGKVATVSEIALVKAVPRYRYIVMSVLWVTGIFLYFDRVNISMAAPHIMQDLSLSAVEMGLILSIFSWGYIPGQLLGGIIGDRYGIRKWSSFWYVVWCLVTFLTGYCRTLWQFLVVRMIFGFSEGTVINQVNKIQNHWAFPNERGFVNGALMFSAYSGLVFGTPIVAWLIDAYDWRMMFFISGAVTLLGVVLFWIFVYDHPHQHPWVSEEEKQALRDALTVDRVNYHPGAVEGEKPSFRAIVGTLASSPVYWAMCGAFFFVNMIYYTNFSWLPGYLQMERGFTSLGSGTALMFPYMAAAAGALSSGLLSDKTGSRSGVIILFALLTMPGIAALLGLDSQSAVIAALCVIMFCNAAAVSTFVVLLFDIFPPYVIGVGLAIMAGVCGGFGGVVGPMLMGISYDMTDSFYTGFVCLGAGMLVSISLMSYVFVHERKVKREKLVLRAI